MPIFVCFNQILILQKVIKISHFQQIIDGDFPDLDNRQFLLAVSGGADSMALSYLFTRLELKFAIAHINYHLRGEDSNLDEELVKTFAEEHNIPLYSYSVTEKDNKPTGSIQVWARDLRYAFFDKIMIEKGFDTLVTAHHLDDQLETFLINLGRGSGMHGLTGIPSYKTLYRPLASFSKEEIYAFAKTENIAFREDYTNKKDDYLRNKLRKKVIPPLKETNAQFLKNFETSIKNLQSVESYAAEQVELFFNKEFSRIEEGFEIEKATLQLAHPFLQYEILKKFGFSNVEENRKIFIAKTGKYFQSETHKLIINRNQLLFTTINELEKTNEIILISSPKELTHANTYTISKEILGLDKPKEINWVFSNEKLVFPIKLRRWKEGDIFYPIEFSGKKKISKFFKDEKLSILAKQKTWLLCDGKDQILGVLPQRQDRRYAEDESTDNCLHICF